MNEVLEIKDQSGLESRADKKPYEKPQIIYSGPLEAMASVCAPAPPGKALPGIDGCQIVSS